MTAHSASIDNPDELLPTRRSLLERLRDLGDQPSWREFFETYWKLIYGAAIRAGPPGRRRQREASGSPHAHRGK